MPATSSLLSRLPPVAAGAAASTARPTRAAGRRPSRRKEGRTAAARAPQDRRAHVLRAGRAGCARSGCVEKIVRQRPALGAERVVAPVVMQVDRLDAHLEHAAGLQPAHRHGAGADVPPAASARTARGWRAAPPAPRTGEGASSRARARDGGDRHRVAAVDWSAAGRTRASESAPMDRVGRGVEAMVRHGRGSFFGARRLGASERPLRGEVSPSRRRAASVAARGPDGRARALSRRRGPAPARASPRRVARDRRRRTAARRRPPARSFFSPPAPCGRRRARRGVRRPKTPSMGPGSSPA